MSAHSVVCAGIHIHNIQLFHPKFEQYNRETQMKIYKSIAVISLGYGITWPIHTYVSIRELCFPNNPSKKCPIYKFSPKNKPPPPTTSAM